MSELNNWLRYQEDEEFERFKAEKGNKRQTKAAMLAGLGLAASLGAVAANAVEAKAEEQGQGVHDLLLCTADSGDKPVETITVDPRNPDYKSYPSSWDNPENILSASAPRFWNGYVFKPFSNYVAGTLDWHIFKMISGEEINVGQMPDGIFAPYMDIISPKTGIVTGTDGKYYKFVDTGGTVNLEELGDIPQWGSLGTSYGGYIFNEHPDLNNQHKSYVLALNEDDILNSVPGLEVPLASEIELQTDGTNKESGGLDTDEQTGELVVALQHGFVTAQLPTLDADGKLPADFSLTELTFSQNSQKTNLGKSTMDVLANQGYKYFKAFDAKSIFAVTPNNAQKYELTNAQLCGNGEATIARVLKLETGGFYIIFDDDFNLPPISLVPTSDPAKFIAPGVPFEKIIDEPTNVTQHIIDDGCTAIPQEYQADFESSPDLCEDVVCEIVDQCKEVSCNPGTGDCEETAKPNGTTCDADANACTVGDACADGQCAPGTPKTCAEPAEQCKKSAGCDANTGNCLVANKTNGAPCNDGDPGTENDECASGVCEGTPVVNPEPEPDVVEPEVEPNPESDDVDVVEQGEDIQDDSVEPDPETEPDVVEGDSSDAVDAVEADQEPDSTDAEPETDVAEQEPDVEIDASVDASGDLAEDDSNDNTEQETDTETESDNSVPKIDEETPGKTPDCSCDVSDTQGQQRGLKEMLLMFGSAALAVIGLRRKKEKS